MRYIKVLFLVILFFLLMMFFVQNQAAFSQATALKLDLLFIPPVQSMPLPFYTLLVLSFVIGGLLVLLMLVWDRISISSRLAGSRFKISSLERELARAKAAEAAATAAVTAAKAAAATAAAANTPAPAER